MFYLHCTLLDIFLLLLSCHHHNTDGEFVSCCWRSVKRLMHRVAKLELHSKIIRPNHSLTSIRLIGG